MECKISSACSVCTLRIYVYEGFEWRDSYNRPLSMTVSTSRSGWSRNGNVCKGILKVYFAKSIDNQHNFFYV